MVKKPLVFSIDNRQNESENEMLCRLKVYRKQARRIKNAISGWPLVPDNTRHYGPVAWTSSLVTNKSKLSNYIWSRMQFCGHYFHVTKSMRTMFLKHKWHFQYRSCNGPQMQGCSQKFIPIISIPFFLSFPLPSFPFRSFPCLKDAPQILLRDLEECC